MDNLWIFMEGFLSTGVAGLGFAYFFHCRRMFLLSTSAGTSVEQSGSAAVAMITTHHEACPKNIQTPNYNQDVS